MTFPNVKLSRCPRRSRHSALLCVSRFSAERTFSLESSNSVRATLSAGPLSNRSRFLDEVDRLHNSSERIERLADQHPPMSKALITIAGNVRGAATLLAVLVATKLHGGNEHP